MTVADGRVRLIADDGALLAEAPLSEIRFDAPIGRTARRLRLPDGTLFETDAHAAADALSGHRLHLFERFSYRLGLVVLLAVAGCVAIWAWALPALVWAAVAMTPEPMKRAIDHGTLQGVDYLLGETTLAPDDQDRVHAIHDRLIAAMDPPEDGRRFRLVFRDAPFLGPNAIALPGGTMVMTDQLVRDFGDDDDVIAGVLGHEIGHVADDHGLTQLYRSLGIYVLVALIIGDTGPILEDALLEGGVALSLSYSRAHEREADLYGIRLAERAGFDPAGLIAFFEKLPDSGTTETGWDSTHPASGERIEAIRDYLSGE